MSKIEWKPTGDDIDDDCVAYYKGLILRAEIMDGTRPKSQPDYGTWWWAVYDGKDEPASSNIMGSPNGQTADQARYACEQAAKTYLFESLNSKRCSTCKWLYGGSPANAPYCDIAENECNRIEYPGDIRIDVLDPETHYCSMHEVKS